MGKGGRRSLAAVLGASLVLGGAAASTALADHSVFEHVSQGQINGNGAFNAAFQGISADGSHVIFQTSEPLVAGDTDTSTDVYERFGGTTTLVSAGQINGNLAFQAQFRGISTDGSRIWFSTQEPLVSSDTDANLDVYERSGGVTTRVSAGQINGNGAIDTTFDGASADGTRVFFETTEPLVSNDTDVNFDIYERSGGTTKRVSLGQINGNGAFNASFAGLSVDGDRVFFNSAEPLVGNDTDAVGDVYERSNGSTKRVTVGQINGNGAFAQNFRGASDDGSRVFFSTTEKLVSNDTDALADVYQRSDGVTRKVSAGQINGNGLFDSFFSGTSAEGSRVFFRTAEKLVSGDTDGSDDLYQRSDGTTKRVSAGQINGNGAFNANLARASTDGARVIFTTSEPLVPADTDTSQDLYQRFDGQTTLISAGQINGNGVATVFIAGASADAKRVFFTTPEQLVPGDTDFQVDVYERFNDVTSLISSGQTGGNGAFGAFPSGTSQSRDGTLFVFFTDEQLAPSDSDSSTDLYSAAVAP
jgi:hypothetical protein